MDMEALHKAQIEKLKHNCERMVAEGTIVEFKYNSEWIEECDRYIASRVLEKFKGGECVVEDDVAHALAAEFFNDSLHDRWEDKDKDNGDDDAESSEPTSVFHPSRAKVTLDGKELETLPPDKLPPETCTTDVKICKETPQSILDDF